MAKKIKKVTIYKIDSPEQGRTHDDPQYGGYKHSYSEFRDDGKLLTEERYNEQGDAEEKYLHRYDASGNLTEEITYLQDDEVAEHKSYERDADGQVIRSYKHYQDGDKDTVHFRRDEEGRIIEKLTVDSDGGEEAREAIEYKGEQLVRRRIYEYDELVFDESYSYDGKGNLEGHTKWTSEEEDMKYVNEFDADGRILSVLKYKLDDKLLEKATYTYENGKLIRILEETPYGSNTTTLIYDDQGNQTGQEEVNQQGEINNRVTRKFNEHGDVTESEVFINLHGRGINHYYVMKYEYEYYD